MPAMWQTHCVRIQKKMGSKYFRGKLFQNKYHKIKGKKLECYFKSQAAYKAINFPFFVNDHDTSQCFSKYKFELLVLELLLKIQSPGICPSSFKSESLEMNSRNLCFYQYPKMMPAAAAAAAKSLQSCPTLCDPTDGSPPGSPVSGILQARTLEWVAISFSHAWKWSRSVLSNS